MKGGVAKTTLCINVAHCLASRHGLKVLVVDIDPQFNATQCLIAPEEYEKQLKNGQPSIVDVFDKDAVVKAAAVSGITSAKGKQLNEILPINIRPNLDLLPGNLNLYKISIPPGQGRELRLRNYIEQDEVAKKYDFVLIDTPPTPSIWMNAALLASQFYVIPVKPDPISFTGVDLLKNVIDELCENQGLKIRCAGLVLTIAESNTTVFQLCQAFLNGDAHWSKYLYKQHLEKRTKVAADQGAQRLILEGNQSSLKLGLSAICEELQMRVKQKN